MKYKNCILRFVHRGNKNIPKAETLFHMFIQFNLNSILMKANNWDKVKKFEFLSPCNS